MDYPLSSEDLVVRVGYHGTNFHLKQTGVTTDKTIRLETVERLNNEYHNLSLGEVHDDGVGRLIDICNSNLSALAEILEWNANHGITFYRASSELLPHITNSFLLSIERKAEYRELAYPIELFQEQFARIGRIIRKYGMRITFHPGLHVVLNTDKAHVYVNALRDIHYHTEMIRLIWGEEGVSGRADTCIILHGGNRNNDSQYYLAKLVENIRSLPLYLRQYLVLENDERNYNIHDILNAGQSTGLPVVFDLFHHKIYYQTTRDLDISDPETQELLRLIANTWAARSGQRMKIHISQQNPDGRQGNHSDYIDYLPGWILEFPETIGMGLDVMIEAKCNERALLALVKKYKKQVSSGQLVT